MSRSVSLVLTQVAAAAFLLACAAHSRALAGDDDGTVLAPAPASTGGTLAPRPTAGTDAPRDGAVATEAADDRPWKLCRTSVVVLLISSGKSQVVERQEQLLFNGESLDFEKEIPLESGSRHAIVRLRTRVQAAVARAPGVVYHVTTDAVLAMAMGFQSTEVGKDQVRHGYLDIEDTLAHLHEAWVSPDLSARIVLSVSVVPVFGRDDAGPLGLDPAKAEIVRFRVETLLREKEQNRLLERTELNAAVDHAASFAFGELGKRTEQPADPAHRFGPGVTVRDLAYLPDSGYGRDHDVTQAAADTEWLATHSRRPSDDFVDAHHVKLDEHADLKTFELHAPPKKLSDRARARLRRQAEIEAATRLAIERSKTLPGGEALPDGYQREELSIQLTPLHVSADYVQAEFRLVGHVRLPHDTALTAIDATFTEEIARGEPFDVGLAELVRGGTPDYDYVFRITPQP